MVQKKIIILGGTSGIGKEMALIYARQGHLVAVTGRRKKLLEELKKQFPQNIITACFDVTETESRQQIAALVHQLNGLDLFIYNAGFGAPSENLEEETERKTTHTNVNGFVETVS